MGDFLPYTLYVRIWYFGKIHIMFCSAVLRGSVLLYLTPLGLGSSQPASRTARARAGTVIKNRVRTADATRFRTGKETSFVEVKPSAKHAPRPCRLPVITLGTSVSTL